MSRLNDLYRERNRQADRANDAEARGFEGTARTARKAAADVDRQIEKAQAAEKTGAWSSRAHP